MEHIAKALTHIAVSKAIPFCYGCYTRASSGRCPTCLSDDLMFELSQVGVEFGTDRLVREILNEHLTPADTLEAFEPFAVLASPFQLVARKGLRPKTTHKKKD